MFILVRMYILVGKLHSFELSFLIWVDANAYVGWNSPGRRLAAPRLAILSLNPETIVLIDVTSSS